MTQRIHHGWFVVLSAGIIFFVQSGFGGYLLGVLQPAWLNEFGWPQTWVSLAFAFGSLLPGLTGVHVGRWTDRFGPRGVIIAGAILLGISYIGLYWIHSFAAFALLFLLGAIARCGISHIPVSAAVTRWFVTRRAVAMGLASTGISLAGVVLVPLTTWLVVSYGWRVTVVVLGVGVWVLIIPITYFVLGGSPEERGTAPYGAKANPDPAKAVATKDASLGSVMRGTTFWLIAMGQMLGTAWALSIGVHSQKAIIDKGMTAGDAAAVISLMATSGLTSRFVYSWLGEVIPAAPLLAATYVLQAAGYALLALSGPGLGVWAFAVCFGFSLGGSVALQSVVVAELYGVRGYAAILGAMALPSSLASAASPVFSAAVHDVTGSYTPAFLTFAVFGLIGSVCLLLAYQRTRGQKAPPEPAAA